MSAFGNLEGAQPQQIFDGVLVRAVHGERITLSVVELDPNMPILEHRHENEQLGVLLEGSMTFRIGDEKRMVGRGATWCIPSNVPHEVKTGPEGAVVVEVFSPPRADWQAREYGQPKAPRWPA